MSIYVILNKLIAYICLFFRKIRYLTKNKLCLFKIYYNLYYYNYISKWFKICTVLWKRGIWRIMSRRVLFIATVVKKHICQFHIPYLKWFKEQDYEVHVCAKNDYDDRSECLIPYCDQYYDVDFSRSPFDFSNLVAYHSIKEIIEKNDYDLIHCHTPVAAAITRLAARKARKKGTIVLYTTHGFHFFNGSSCISKLYYYIEKYLIKYTDGIITINSEDYKTASKFCGNKSCEVFYVHGMGVDTEKISSMIVDKTKLKQDLKIPDDAIVLLSVSEINKNKNLETTLRAFAEVKDNRLYYLICGSGNLYNKCEALANELGISDRVIFAGYRYDIFEVVHIADIFLFPSYREGLGVAAIEAMSAGVPLIASDIRGIREYAVNMHNSILLNPDDVTGYSKAIKTLVNDPELREFLGENALKAVEPFELKSSVRAMGEIYCSYLGTDRTIYEEAIKI